MPGTCPSCGGATIGHSFDGDRVTAHPCGCPITWGEAQRLAGGSPDPSDDDPPEIRADGAGAPVDAQDEVDLEVGDEIRLADASADAFAFTIAEIDDTTVEFEDGDVAERDSLEGDIRDGRYVEHVPGGDA